MTRMIIEMVYKQLSHSNSFSFCITYHKYSNAVNQAQKLYHVCKLKKHFSSSCLV